MAVPRGSIFGALLLISIGGLFLWANLDSAVRPWHIVGRYWPILIMFWGLSKLVDYLALRGTPEAGRAARLSGGDIVLLIFILLMGTAITRATQRGFWEGMGIEAGDEEWGRWFENRYQFTQKLEQTIKTPAVLNITNNGSVTLTAQPGDRLQATVKKVVFAPSEAEAERLSAEIEVVLEPITVSPTGGGPAIYELRWRRPGEAGGPVRADIELSVPTRLGTKLEVRRGDVRVSGLEGDVSVSAMGDADISGITGNVKVEARRGSVRVNTVRGDVEIRGRGDEVSVSNIRGEARIEGEFTGPIRAANVTAGTRFTSRRTTFTAERIEGELTLERGDLNLRRAAGNVTLTAEDKDIYLEELLGAIRCENRHGIIQLRFPRPPREPIEVESRSGDIELILPGNSDFTIEARAPAGEISSDFSGPGLDLKTENGGASLTGTYGSRGANIRLHSRYGSIRLVRAGATTTGSTSR